MGWRWGTGGWRSRKPTRLSVAHLADGIIITHNRKTLVQVSTPTSIFLKSHTFMVKVHMDYLSKKLILEQFVSTFGRRQIYLLFPKIFIFILNAYKYYYFKCLFLIYLLWKQNNELWKGTKFTIITFILVTNFYPNGFITKLSLKAKSPHRSLKQQRQKRRLLLPPENSSVSNFCERKQTGCILKRSHIRRYFYIKHRGVPHTYFITLNHIEYKTLRPK